MTDVARSAQVSTATVSNVLNRPGTVALVTRSRVEKVIRELGYVLDENAAILRRGTSASHNEGHRKSPETHGSHCSARKTSEAKVSVVSDVPRTYRPDSSEELARTVTSGDRVSLVSEGRTYSGVVDAVMPDGSAVWIWCDGGLGRRLITLQSALVPPGNLTE